MFVAGQNTQEYAGAGSSTARLPTQSRHRSHRQTRAHNGLSLARRALRAILRMLSGRKSASYIDDLDFNVARCKPDRIDALCRTTKFTKEELKMIYQGFKQACPTGMVSEHSFKDIYAQFFPQGADATLYAHYVFKVFDQDKNGTITFKDFVQGLSTLSRGSTLEKLQWTFNLYDIDGDGRVSKEEMYEITNAIYCLLGRFIEPEVDEVSTRDHAERVFQKLDLNHDGVVTFDEFVEICTKDEVMIKSMNLLDTVL